MRQFLKDIWKRIVACFLGGLFAVLPLVITVVIVMWVASFVKQFVGPNTFLGGRLRGLGIQWTGEGADTVAYVIGWLVVLLTIFGLGVLLELGAKRLFSQLLDQLIRRIPLVSSVYATSKQMVDMLDNEGSETDIKGMSPVLCHFGGNTGPAVLALLASPETYVVGETEYQIVIIPTAPVPFGGALLLVPRESVTRMSMPVEGLLNIYASMGISASQFLQVKPT